MGNYEIEQLNENLQFIRKTLVQHGEKLSDITQLLTGNPLNKKDEGVIGRVDKVERRLEEVDAELQKSNDLRKKAGWAIGGAVMAGTFFMGLIQLIVKYIFKL